MADRVNHLELYTDLMVYPFEALEKSSPDDVLILDTETCGHTEDTHFVIYFSWASGNPNDGVGSGAGPCTTTEGFRFLQAILNSPRPKVFHNITADLEFLRKSGLTVGGKRGYCTSLAHALIDEYDQKNEMLSLVKRYFGRERPDYWELETYKKGVPPHKKNLYVPQALMQEYAHNDAMDTLDLWNKFFHTLTERKQWDLYEVTMDAEMQWYQMEIDGIEFDVEAAEESLSKIDPIKAVMEEEIHAAFGEKFLITSHKQLGAVLSKNLPLTVKTKTGWATGKEELRKFRYDPRVQMIIGYKMLAQCSSKIRKRIEQGGNRLFPEYKQTLVTGRSSCSGTPLQQIPKRAGRVLVDDVGSEVLAEACSAAYRGLRKMWLPAPGAMLVTFDYDQGEYRAAAHYTHSQRLISLMQDPDADFHMIITRLIFPDAEESLLKVLRDIVKHVSFGLLYGMSAPGIERTIVRLSGKALTEFTSETPAGIMRKYEDAVPEMRKFQQDVLAIYKERGFVVDVFGRQYHEMPDWFKRVNETDDYAIINYLCQGTVGNVKRYAIARLYHVFKRLREEDRRSKMILDIHDELGFEIFPEDAELLRDIHHAMTDFPQFSLPFTTSPNVGFNLLEVKEYTLDEAIEVCRTQVHIHI